MEPESAIIAACIASRDAYDVVVKLEATTDLSPNGMELFKHIANYYKADTTTRSVNSELLLGTIQNRKPLSYEKLSVVIENLPEASPSNLVTYLTEQRLKRLGADMTAALAGGDSDKASTIATEYKEVHELGIQSDEQGDDLFDVYQGATVSDLTRTLDEGDTLSILPDLLGDIVFNMMPGDHVVVFGGVNRGKSAVAIQIAGDYGYADKTVLYIGNEDPADRMVLRIVCNFVGKTLETVREDDEHWTKEAKAEGYNNIIFKELSPGTVTDVERLIAHFKPHIVICDQARNLAPAPRQGAFTDTQAEVMYQLRMLYKRTKVVGVSLTQASSTDMKGRPIDNKVKLEQSDIFGSRREVAAQADVMIGVGGTEQMKEQGQLYLNVCKNKASGVHDGVYAFINPFKSCVDGGD